MFRSLENVIWHMADTTLNMYAVFVRIRHDIYKYVYGQCKQQILLCLLRTVPVDVNRPLCFFFKIINMFFTILMKIPIIFPVSENKFLEIYPSLILRPR